MSDSAVREWHYWRDKKGVVDALDQYPNLLARTPQLQQAIFMIAAAEALINQIMENLQEEDDPDS